MASFDDIKALRLKISDPSGVIDILSVASVSALPASPLRQTAYLKADISEYVRYDFDLLAWDVLPLKISDERLGALIDLWGVSDSTPKAIRAIMATLGQEMQLKRITMGADSTEYLTLKDAYDFYKMLINEYMVESAEESGSTTGRYFRTRQPRIAGGHV